jgi:hypothetical protein
MRLIFSVFLCAFFVCTAFSQKPGNLQKLTDQFEQVYSKFYKDSSDFYSALSFATTSTFTPQNAMYKRTWQEFDSLQPGLKEGELIKLIGDSVLNRFYIDYFWKTESLDKVKFYQGLSLYSNRVCPCLTTKLKAGGKTPDIVTIANACNSALMSDPSFLSQMQASIREFSLPEKQRMQVMLSKYVYQYCPAYNNAVNDILFHAAGTNYGKYISGFLFNLEKTIGRVYKQKKLDSLSTIFPGYKTYKQDIERSLPVVMAGHYTLANYADDSLDNSRIRNVTFYTQNKDVKIMGQVTVKYRVDKLNVFVSSYRFLSPEQIPNKQVLIDEITSLPEPPPFPELIEKPSPKKQ